MLGLAYRRGVQPLKILGVTVLVVILVACGLVFRSLQLRPCVAARAIFASYSDVSGYGTFQGMLAGDFRHRGGHEFIYIESDANPLRRTKAPRAKFVRVTLGIFNGSGVQTMTVPVSEFYSFKAKPLTCDGDFDSPFINPK